MNRRREGWPISRKYWRESFSAASTASDHCRKKADAVGLLDQCGRQFLIAGGKNNSGNDLTPVRGCAATSGGWPETETEGPPRPSNARQHQIRASPRDFGIGCWRSA
jgi:hypothetical protein